VGQDGIAHIVTRVRAGQATKCSFVTGSRTFYVIYNVLTARHTHPPALWVTGPPFLGRRRQGHKTGRMSPSGTWIKNEWRYAAADSYAFLVCTVTAWAVTFTDCQIVNRISGLAYHDALKQCMSTIFKQLPILGQ